VDTECCSHFSAPPRLCASLLFQSAVIRFDRRHRHSIISTYKIDLADVVVPELAFGVIRFWIFEFRFWKQVIQKRDLWQFEL